MRKIKKINGYLVVKFNDRERREWEQLGVYGVIDAELYTGTLEVDRSVMECDDAETLEEAIEKARGLESELDVKEPDVKITVIKETDEATSEEEFNPQLLIAGWETALGEQIKSGHHPNVNPMTARHELYGFKVALRELGLLASSECYVLPDAFDNDNCGISETAQTGKGPSDKRTGPRGTAHEEAVKHMAECYLKRHPVPKQIEVDNG